MIHPTAIVHPHARLGSNCHIGPYCLIGEHVELGEECHLHSHVVIDGHTQLGRRNRVFPFASIGLQTQDLKWKGGITRTRIGDDNTFRENVTVNSATGDGEETIVGSRNHILAYAHIAHNVTLGNDIVISNVGTLAGHVTVEDQAVIGGLAAVHQFCRIGRLSIIGGCSKVVQDVPPFMLADGNPASLRTINKIGLARRGVPEDVQKHIRKAYRILFRMGLTLPNAIAQLETEISDVPEIQELIKFLQTSERGVTRSSKTASLD